MNELIRKLSEQAQDWADAHSPYASEEHEYFAEKFSELLIKECISIMEHAHDNKMRLSDAIWNTRTKFGVRS